MATNEKNQSQDPPRGRLLRSRDERMLTGVAGGVGKYLGIDPTFVRLAFAGATLFGGFGILAYLVMAAVVPEDDGEGNPLSGRPPVWVIVGLGIAGLVLLPGPFFGWGDGWFFGIGLLWLAAIVIVGVLAVQAMRGDRPMFGGRRTESSGVAGSGDLQTGDAKTEVMGTQPEGTAPRLVRVLAIALIGILALGAAVGAAALAAFATATGNGVVVAGVIISLGIGVAASTFFGEGARRSAPWLLAIALILAVPAGSVAAADVRFDGGVGERTYAPATAAEIPEDGYELGVGQLKIDLRELEIAPGEVVEVPADLGLGQMVIGVPSDVCVIGHAEAKGGDLLVRGQSNGGAGVEFDRGPGPDPKLPSVDIDAELQFGQLVVTDRDPEEYGDHGPGPGPGRDGDPDELTEQPEGCAG